MPTANKILINKSDDGLISNSPAWVLTFVRWKYRFLNFSKNIADTKLFECLPPLIVRSDCVSLTVSASKSSHTPSMQAVLYGSEINYSTAIAPGDFVIVNIVNSEEKADEIVKLASQLKPINEADSGFKGIFRVQSVRQVLNIDPSTGIKILSYQVLAYGFTEFNSIIYFNPFLVSKDDTGPSGYIKFVSRISDQWRQFLLSENKKGVPSVQRAINLFINVVLGTGFNNSLNIFKENIPFTPNKFFLMPRDIGKLLGVENVRVAPQIYSLVFGIQEYTANNSKKQLKDILVPKIISEVQGAALIKPEYWSEVTLWSILNQYSNNVINELYTAYQIDKTGRIMPCVVLRQIPFSTNKIKYKNKTNFFTIPRFVIHSNSILNVNLGRDDALRFNFFQLFSTVPAIDERANVSALALQIGNKNFKEDTADIVRSGLRPYIRSSDFDEIISTKQALKNPEWVNLISDFNFAGHLKFTGSITCIGIEEPIAPGYNLELDGIVYHIQSVVHNCSISSSGNRTFFTSIDLVNGLDVRSENQEELVFPYMDNTDMDKEKEFVESRDNLIPAIDSNYASQSDQQKQNIDKISDSVDNDINYSFPQSPNSGAGRGGRNRRGDRR